MSKRSVWFRIEVDSDAPIPAHWSVYTGPDQWSAKRVTGGDCGRAEPAPKPEPKPAPQKSNGSNGHSGLDKTVESLCRGLGHRGNASLRTKLGRVKDELGIRTIGDLLGTDRDVVKCVHLFGPGSIARLEVALAKRGLEWD